MMRGRSNLKGRSVKTPKRLFQLYVHYCTRISLNIISNMSKKNTHNYISNELYDGCGIVRCDMLDIAGILSSSLRRS